MHNCEGLDALFALTSYYLKHCSNSSGLWWLLSIRHYNLRVFERDFLGALELPLQNTKPIL